jgi:cysteine synthase
MSNRRFDGAATKKRWPFSILISLAGNLSHAQLCGQSSGRLVIVAVEVTKKMWLGFLVVSVRPSVGWRFAKMPLDTSDE